MDRISPLMPGGVPEPTTPLTPTGKPATPSVGTEAGVAKNESGVEVQTSESQVNTPPAAASPEQLSALRAAIASGQLPVDPQAIANAIVRAFTGSQS